MTDVVEDPADGVTVGRNSAATGQAQRRRSTRQLFVKGMQGLGLGFFYVCVVAYFGVKAPHFLTFSNASAILANVAVLGIVAAGQALAMISGGFDLSVSATVPLGAVAYAEFVNHGFGVAGACVAVLAVGAGVGLCNAVVVTRVGINPLIATLGSLSIFGGLAYTITNGQTIPFNAGVQDAAGVWGNNIVGTIEWAVLAFLVVGVCTWALLRYTVFGRTLYAIGGNRDASRLAGLRVDLTIGAVYVISGALGAFGGAVTASQLLAGSPTVGPNINLSSITAVVLGGGALAGGVGGIPGTMLGVLLLGTLANGMALMLVPAFDQTIATGAVLLLAVGFAQLRAAAMRRAQ